MNDKHNLLLVYHVRNQSYSQGYDDNGGEDNIKYNKEKDDMNNKDNNDEIFFSKLSVVMHFQNHELKPK